MAKGLIQESTLTAIGDAIRSKNGSSVSYKPSEMAAAITAIESGGGASLPDNVIQSVGGIFKVTNSTLSVGECVVVSPTLVLPSQYTVIDKNALGSHSGAVDVSGDSITFINSQGFTSNSGLKSVSFPNCTKVGYSALNGCGNLTSALFPKATLIDSYCMYNCRKLTTVDFSKVTETKYKAFGLCTSLTYIYFPELTKMDKNTFEGCAKLKSVYMPKLATLKTDTFKKCTAMTDFYTEESNSNVATIAAAIGSGITIYNMDKSKKYDTASSTWVAI